MSNVFYLVYSGGFENGVVIEGRDRLEAFYSTLSHDERQGFTQLEFEREALEEVLRVSGCKLLEVN